MKHTRILFTENGDPCYSTVSSFTSKGTFVSTCPTSSRYWQQPTFSYTDESIPLLFRSRICNIHVMCYLYLLEQFTPSRWSTHYFYVYGDRIIDSNTCVLIFMKRICVTLQNTWKEIWPEELVTQTKVLTFLWLSLLLLPLISPENIVGFSRPVTGVCITQ